MKEIVSTLVRNVFKICGPLVAAKGWVDESSLEAIGGAVATIVAVVWGVVDARSASKAKAETKAFKAGHPGDFGKSSQTRL